MYSGSATYDSNPTPEVIRPVQPAAETRSLGGRCRFRHLSVPPNAAWGADAARRPDARSEARSAARAPEIVAQRQM